MLLNLSVMESLRRWERQLHSKYVTLRSCYIITFVVVKTIEAYCMVIKMLKLDSCCTSGVVVCFMLNQLCVYCFTSTSITIQAVLESVLVIIFSWKMEGQLIMNRWILTRLYQKYGILSTCHVWLQQQLDMGIGENRHATHRNQRWYDLTERAYEYSRGPLMYQDLMTYERLDRPQVRVFQRHPGTQLKEPQEIVRVSWVNWCSLCIKYWWILSLYIYR